MPIVYLITYPNGKIYVGQDRTDSIGYFGGPSTALIDADFTPEQQLDMTIRREILWRAAVVTQAELNTKEVEMILLHRANDPTVGYNQRPRFIPPPA